MVASGLKENCAWDPRRIKVERHPDSLTGASDGGIGVGHSRWWGQAESAVDGYQWRSEQMAPAVVEGWWTLSVEGWWTTALVWKHNLTSAQGAQDLGTGRPIEVTVCPALQQHPRVKAQEAVHSIVDLSNASRE